MFQSGTLFNLWQSLTVWGEKIGLKATLPFLIGLLAIKQVSILTLIISEDYMEMITLLTRVSASLLKLLRK